MQELIEGHPLSTELLPDQPWTESQVVQLLQEVLGILKFVHSHGLIHQDVKPSNLIRRQQDKRLVLINFSSSKLAWSQVVAVQGNSCTTFAYGISSTASGTPGYMPTEQEQGRAHPNSDIYALGMIGIQALTGLSPTQLLEDSDTGKSNWQHQTLASAGLISVLNKMVCYDFKDRYQSAQEALQALDLLSQELIEPSTQQPSPAQLPLTVTSVTSAQQDTVLVFPDKRLQPQAASVQTIPQKTIVQSPSVLGQQVGNAVKSRLSLKVSRNPIHASTLLRVWAPLLLLIGVSIGMSIAAISGVTYANMQLNQIRNLTRQGQYGKCINKAELESRAAQTFLSQDVQLLLNECRLRYARSLAAGTQFAAAINIAQKIPTDSPYYPQAQKLIHEWLEI